MPPITLYATRTDLEQVKVVSAQVQQLEPAIKDQLLANGSAYVDTYLAKRYTLPLVAVDAAVKRHTLSIVIWDMMSMEIGLNPDSSYDKVFRQNFQDAIAWLEGVVAATIDPSVTDSAGKSTGSAAGTTPSTSTSDRATVRSSRGRGWTTEGGECPGLFQSDRRRR